MSITKSVSFSKFSDNFDQVAAFYWNGYFTCVNEDGLVYDYDLCDYLDCDMVFSTMQQWKYVVVVMADREVNVFGLSLDDVNEM
jgi:hypothetical protein